MKYVQYMDLHKAFNICYLSVTGKSPADMTAVTVDDEYIIIKLYFICQWCVGAVS